MRAFKTALLFLLCLGSAGALEAASTITTVAGGGPNNIPALAAGIPGPTGVALDGLGNLFIASSQARQVFKVDASGTITIVAGIGAPGFNGDNIPATSATLFSPFGVALDAAGNLFITELTSSRIRRVDASTGIITTVAGSGAYGFNGDNIPATNARLADPVGVALDAAGNLFIADLGNHRIRRVDASTGLITTVAGTGTPGFNGDNIPATSATLHFPWRVALDARGNLFIADNFNHRIRRVDALTQIITTVAGTGTSGFTLNNIPATSATVAFPNGVALDAAGNLFIATEFDERIHRVDAQTQIISTVAGTGTFGFNGDNIPATSAWLANPDDVALDAMGNLFIADASNQRVRRVTFGGGAPSVTLAGATTAGEGTTQSYTFSVNDGAFSVKVGFPECGIGGSLVAGSLSITGTGGSFQCHFPFPNGPANSTVSVQITSSGGEDSNVATLDVAVSNIAPTVTAFSGPTATSEGQTRSYTFVVTDPGQDTFTLAAGSPSCGTGGTLVPGSLTTTATGGSFACTFPDGPATPTVSVQVADSDGAAGNLATLTVAVANAAPTATFAAPATVNEGTAIALALTTPADPSAADTAAGFTYAFDCGDGAGYGPFGAAATASCPTTDNGIRTVKGKVRDKDGGETEHTAAVTARNVVPAVAITGAPAASPEGAAIAVASTVTDPGADTLTYAWAVTKNGTPFASGSTPTLTFTPDDNGT